MLGRREGGSECRAVCDDSESEEKIQNVELQTDQKMSREVQKIRTENLKKWAERSRR